MRPYSHGTYSSGKKQENALFLCPETAVKWCDGCVFLCIHHQSSCFFCIFFISLPLVQEDAEPRAKPPVWDESLRQPSVRVHLQHLPRWALSHIFTHTESHTLYHALNHHMPYHIYTWQRVWGYSKHVPSNGETRSLSKKTNGSRFRRLQQEETHPVTLTLLFPTPSYTLPRKQHTHTHTHTHVSSLWLALWSLWVNPQLKTVLNRLIIFFSFVNMSCQEWQWPASVRTNRWGAKSHRRARRD